MSTFSIAVAQSCSIKGDIESNVRTHAEYVRVAVEHNVDVIVFPELSLTGYEPEIAREVAITLDNEHLAPLREQAQRFEITIIAGAPIACPEGKPYIGALILNSDNSRVYLKQHLHPGEEEFFSPSPGRKGCVMDVNGVGIGVAICADINHASHAEEAAKNGASMYAASVLITDSGYSTDTQRLQHYATEHTMTVLMANHGSSTGGYIPAGKSAIWDHSGKLLATTDGTGNALVLATKVQGKWAGKTLAI